MSLSKLFKPLINKFRTKYYIYSYKHTNGLVHTFWGPNRGGYTIDLNQAGIYYIEDCINDTDYYPLVHTKESLQRYIKAGYDNFYIKEADIEKVLDKKMICVLN